MIKDNSLIQEQIIDGYCGCGCGEVTNIWRGKHRKFIKGHQARGSCNSRFGIKLSDDIKEKISVANQGKYEGENNPFFGQKHSNEAKIKMSQKGKGVAKTPRRGLSINCIMCNSPYYVNQARVNTSFYCSKKCQGIDYKNKLIGEQNPFFGKHHSEHVKEKLRQFSSEQRSKQVNLPTKPERIIHEELSKLKINFEAEKLINGKFCVDIFIPSKNLIIYIDGCYWHACPMHFPNRIKPNSDLARIPYLTKCGFNVETLWEHDININSEGLIKEICLKYNLVN